MRYVGPWLLKKGVEKMAKQAETRMREAQGHDKRPEGSVTIETNKKGTKGNGEDDGEYVDFEEIN